MADRKPYKYPAANTLRAVVLANLLETEQVIGTENVFGHTTTNVSTVIRVLIKKCHWPIERHDCVVDLGDGRKGWTSTWYLSQEVIDVVLDASGREWLESVRAAREARIKRLTMRPCRPSIPAQLRCA